MKKSKTKTIQRSTKEQVSIEEALQFLDSFHQMISSKDEPTKLISLRVPENILRSVKIKAKYEGKKYQTMIVQALRDFLNKN